MNFEPTRTRTRVILYAGDPATLLSLYTHIEVQRAPNADGQFVPITQFGAESAAAITAQKGPYRLNGTHLTLLLPDGTTPTHVFTGADPISAADAATELNTAIPALDCADDGNDALVLRTAATGTEAVLQVLSGDALWWLGIPSGTTSFGLDAHVPLSAGVYIYSQIDENGSFDYAYRYRFVKEAPPAQSQYLLPVAEGRDITTDIDKLAVGYLRVTEQYGVSTPGRKVHVASRGVPPSVNSTLVVGEQVKELDVSGYAFFLLVRGIQVEFYVMGTPLHRIITVPDVQSFDMLDGSLVQDDAWGIIVPPYDALPRTT